MLLSAGCMFILMAYTATWGLVDVSGLWCGNIHGPCYHWRPCSCQWSMGPREALLLSVGLLPPEAMLIWVASVAIWGHVDVLYLWCCRYYNGVHSLWHNRRPCWCSWSVLLLEIIMSFMTNLSAWDNEKVHWSRYWWWYRSYFFCSIDDFRLTSEREGTRRPIRWPPITVPQK